MTFQAIPERQSQAGISKGFSHPSPLGIRLMQLSGFGPLLL